MGLKNGYKLEVGMQCIVQNTNNGDYTAMVLRIAKGNRYFLS